MNASADCHTLNFRAFLLQFIRRNKVFRYGDSWRVIGGEERDWMLFRELGMESNPSLVIVYLWAIHVPLVCS